MNELAHDPPPEGPPLSEAAYELFEGVPLRPTIDETESGENEWHETVALVTSARARAAWAEERIAELEARGEELLARLAEEIAALTRQMDAADRRRAEIDEARTLAQQRAFRAERRIAVADQFSRRMRHTLRMALPRSGVGAHNASGGPELSHVPTLGTAPPAQD